MTANPDQAASGDDPAQPGAPAPEATPEAAAEPAPLVDDPAPDLFADPPRRVVPPPPEPAPVAAPAETVLAAAPLAAAPEELPEPASEPVAPPSRRSRSARHRPMVLGSEPEPEPAPRAASEAEAGAGDFDAVFEARSSSGLGERLMPTFCYLLMVIGPLTLGLSAVPAAFLAYVNRETAPRWISSHYLFQIRTFWIGTIVALLAGTTFLFVDRGVIGLFFGAFFALIMLVGVVWFVLRSAIGLNRLRRGAPIANYRTWWV